MAEKSLQSYQRVLERYAFPLLGKMPVSSLKTPDFLDALRRVEATNHLVSMKFLYTESGAGAVT
ncbi:MULTISPECIES: phage integrase central domain-containing protein [Limnobaculum]|uniref:phage integrase central domain-containing protein n=1 Tax=Limnobaculum TaxID=2172100 RepID=UPI0038990D7B